jgi:hypothetical protein
VLLVAPFGVLGGAERWLLSLLDATDRLTVTAVLLATGRSGPTGTARDPRPVRPVGSARP